MSDKYQKLPMFHFSQELKKNHARKKLKCLIFGNFGAKNIGDEAILAGQLQELAKIPNLTVTVVARFPEEVRKIHNVRSIPLYSLSKVAKEIRKSDFVIIGGGGIISKIERGLIGFIYQLYMLYIFFLLPRFYKKKIYAIGVGVYDNANAFILLLTRFFLRHVNILTVRDFHTYEYLKSKNIHNRLFKDNSFLLDLVLPKGILQDDFIKRTYDKTRINIGISLVKPESKREEKKLLSEISTFISKNHVNATFWFFPCDYHSSYENDEKFGHRLHEIVKKRLGREVHFYFIPTSWSPQIFFSAFKLMDFFVSMRLHADIFAYRTEVDFVGIAYDKKCSSFLHSIGHENMTLKDISAKTLQKKLEESLEQ